MSSEAESIDKIRKKVTYTHELISAAYHESGHTIYGLLHHMKIEMVHVFEDKKTKRMCGFTHFNYSDPSEIEDSALSLELMKAEICLNYSGLCAEKHHFKNVSGSDKFPSFWKNGSSSDTIAAAALMKEYNLAPSGKKRYNFKKKLIKETHEQLQLYWSDVTLVAHALFKKKRLYFDDLKNLLSKKSENKEFWKIQFKDINYIFQNGETIDETTLKSMILSK